MPRSPRGTTVRRRPAAGPTGGPWRSRLAVAAVAAGALTTAGHGIPGLGGLEDLAEPSTTELAIGSLSLAAGTASSGDRARSVTAPEEAGPDAATAGVVPVSAGPGTDTARTTSLASLSKAHDRVEAQKAAAAKPTFVKPAQGTFTSGFGSRWGTTHKGVDIANSIGTPIVSVADGVVTAAGPASGFGLWVKVRLEDGTETVYGHVNKFFVSEGEQVTAGQEIAEIGNRGQSTGPHLHFEVHTPSGKKINPRPWLAERGISLGAEKA